jgi:hypothetical protein
MKYDLESLKSRPYYLDTSLTSRPISKSLNRSAGGSGDKYFSPPQLLVLTRPPQVPTPYPSISIRRTSTFYAFARGEKAEVCNVTFTFRTRMHKKSVTEEVRSELITALMKKAQVFQKVTTCQLVLSLTQKKAVDLHSVGGAP